MIVFMIPGDPRGKERPRFTKSGRAFTAKETVAREREILRIFADAVPSSFKPFTGPIFVEIWAIFPIPAGWNKAQTAQATAGRMWHTQKPDKDNIEKLVLDALNEHAWADDGQICGGGTWKRFGYPARTEVRIYEAPWKGEGERVKAPSEIAREKRAAETPSQWLSRKQKASKTNSARALKARAPKARGASLS